MQVDLQFYTIILSLYIGDNFNTNVGLGDVSYILHVIINNLVGFCWVFFFSRETRQAITGLNFDAKVQTQKICEQER